MAAFVEHERPDFPGRNPEDIGRRRLGFTRASN
jgi:hypothetical protein